MIYSYRASNCFRFGEINDFGKTLSFRFKHIYEPARGDILGITRCG